MSTWADCWIGFLELPTRALTVFEREGVSSLGQLDAMTFAHLRDLGGIGPKTAHEVFDAIDAARHRFRSGRLCPQSKSDHDAELALWRSGP